MLSGHTVLVLGAGSSVAFGMPVGSDLASGIANHLNISGSHERHRGDQAIRDAILSQPGHGRPDELWKAGHRVAKTVPEFKSIDDCLYTHSADADMLLMGKVGIARVISNYESISPLDGLFAPDQERRAKAAACVRTSWVHTLCHHVFTGHKVAEADKVFSKLSIVNFNYDRCAEVAIWGQLMRTFRIDEAEAAAIMKTLPIFRPYGSLGGIELRSGGGGLGAPGIPLFDLARNIKIYTEDMSERRDLDAIAGLLAQASRVLFLGFAFHPQNMRVLHLGDAQRETHKDIYVSAMKETPPRRQSFRQAVQKAFSFDAVVTGDTCEIDQLLRDYSLRLTA